MSVTTTLSPDGCTLTVTVPMVLRRKGGRKLILLPEGVAAPPAPSSRADAALVKALGRAHRWRKLLESGRFSSMTELAEREGINHSYLCRILRLSLLAPDLVAMILDGRQPKGLRLADLMGEMPVEWGKQRPWMARLARGSKDEG